MSLRRSFRGTKDGFRQIINRNNLHAYLNLSLIKQKGTPLCVVIFHESKIWTKRWRISKLQPRCVNGSKKKIYEYELIPIRLGREMRNGRVRVWAQMAY